MLGVSTLDPVFIYFEFISKSGGAQGYFFETEEPGDEAMITSVSEEELLVARFFGSIQYTVSSEVFEAEVSIVNYLKLILKLSFNSLHLKKISVLSDSVSTTKRNRYN